MSGKIHHREPGGLATCSANKSRRWLSKSITSNSDWDAVTCAVCLRLRHKPLIFALVAANLMGANRD